MIRENVTADSHFSGNWLDMKLSEWALRTHEKSSDDEEEKKKTRERGRKKGRRWRGQARERCPDFTENMLDFQSIYDILWSKKSCRPWLLCVFFYVSFYFHKVFVSPRQVQVFTPVKGSTKPSTKTRSFIPVSRSFAPNSSKGFLFIVARCFLRLLCGVFLLRRRGKQKDNSTHANGLWSWRTPAAGSRFPRAANTPKLSVTLPSAVIWCRISQALLPTEGRKVSICKQHGGGKRKNNSCYTSPKSITYIKLAALIHLNICSQDKR